VGTPGQTSGSKRPLRGNARHTVATRRKIDPVPLAPENLKYRTAVRVREYAQLTGLPVPSVYAMIHRGDIAVERRGHSLLIPRAQIPGLG